MINRKSQFLLVLLLLVTMTTSLSFADTSLERIEGASRYETSINIAKKASPDATSLLVVSGLNFPDALSASILIKEHGPIVLANNKDHVEAIVKSFPKLIKVEILGGEQVVSKEVANSFSQHDIDVYRTSGQTRYETSAAISKKAGNFKSFILVSGKNFPDGLAASYLSKHLEAPILLTDGKSLTPEVKALLKGADDVTILGGTAAISEAVEKEVSALAHVTLRLKGDTRYETALFVANHLGSPKGYILASGKNFPDGLAGAALIQDLNYPLLLVDEDETLALDFLKSKNTGIEKVFALGGTSAISEKTFNLIKENLVIPEPEVQEETTEPEAPVETTPPVEDNIPTDPAVIKETLERTLSALESNPEGITLNYDYTKYHETLFTGYRPETIRNETIGQALIGKNYVEIQEDTLEAGAKSTKYFLLAPSGDGYKSYIKLNRGGTPEIYRFDYDKDAAKGFFSHGFSAKREGEVFEQVGSDTYRLSYTYEGTTDYPTYSMTHKDYVIADFNMNSGDISLTYQQIYTMPDTVVTESTTFTNIELDHSVPMPALPSNF